MIDSAFLADMQNMFRKHLVGTEDLMRKPHHPHTTL